MPRMNRRHLLLRLAGLGLASALAPARAQYAAAMPRVAVFTFGSAPNARGRTEAFQKGMRELGYVEGTNVRYEWRSANGQPDLLRRMAAETVRERPDVIVSTSTLTTQALFAATRSIPIVMGAVEDPVASGFVKSLARPETNVTGLTSNVLTQVGRFVELLAMAVPRLPRLAALTNPDNATYDPFRKRLDSIARAGRMRLVLVDATGGREIEHAMRKAAAERASGMVVMSDGNFYTERATIAELAAKFRIPAIYPQQGYVDAGGLMSYGQNLEYNFFRAASFVDRILKGAKPADLPVEQPANYELVVNREAARAIEIELPQELLRRADKVIG
jgi:putative ABC transport system substrate-binding protein